MKSRILRNVLLVGLLSVLVAGCASPTGKYFKDVTTPGNVYVLPGHGKIRKIAVMPFRAPTELVGSSVSDMMVTELLRCERYTLVERGQMAQVLNESELALAGLSATKAVEIGTMLGADGVVIGTVDEYGTVAQRGRSYPVVGVSVRLIDCSSGRIVWSVDMAQRAARPDVTLAQHARKVVHDLAGTLYNELRRTR
ncbi:MAG TPA: CsgG/HfaB family protein [Kiritimatiellia bacterium]|jgi:TolB-like protein|nr:hypothetical protein [Kiritimatiellia bacterium]OQC59779.1 MAG: Curli production assembly/transport component CsgG [Verrucomicrobia bacterium ADurb.Bin018]MBP9572947.1 hypothetical protein [Kiritimatiellia bacterium]HOE00133.1 CsgG/HfaB family protein [Kiritimatiellia bacterium]HOE37422.1 CsgG/HfaB family protein [Kiritimatiellia bacterium]